MILTVKKKNTWTVKKDLDGNKFKKDIKQKKEDIDIKKCKKI